MDVHTECKRCHTHLERPLVSTTNDRRLTVESLAPLVSGCLRPAPQPLGTWMSRWSVVYGDAATRVEPPTTP
jgi:hypothetical protein